MREKYEIWFVSSSSSLTRYIWVVLRSELTSYVTPLKSSAVGAVWRWLSRALEGVVVVVGVVAGSLAARCSARTRRRRLDSSSRWRLAFANKLLAAAAGLLSLCLQKRLGRVEPLCEEADTPTNNETKQSSPLCLLSPNIRPFFEKMFHQSPCDKFNFQTAGIKKSQMISHLCLSAFNSHSQIWVETDFLFILHAL